MNIKNKILVIGVLTLFSCKQNFSLERQWRRDRWGCNKERLKLAAFIQKNENEYLGLDVYDLIKLLGEPNVIRESENGLKRLYYYIDFGDQCSSSVRKDKVLLEQGLHAPTLSFIIKNNKVYDIVMNFS